MPTLNPHTFPLVAYPGPAPESAPRSGMGGWDFYTLAAPSDRLLCFVLSRRLLPSNSPWVNCAWVQHADTGQRYATLVPTGTSGTTPALGLPLTKLIDQANGADHFTYNGAPIPGLADLLPCGVPLRLVVENTYQSPRFYALAPAATLPVGYLLVEWQHDGPLQGVPYGRGFRQQLYIDNAALAYLDPRQEKESTKNADNGVERIDSLSLFAQTEFTLPLVPAYLAQAMSAAAACRYLTADGQPWKLTATKSAVVGTDGGRWTITGTLENQTPLLRRGVQAPSLPTEAFSQGAPPRGWRCGDSSDTAPDVLPTGNYTCELSNGANTGYAQVEYKDLNPYSAGYGTATTQRQQDGRCPLPTVYRSRYNAALPQKNDCSPGQIGSLVPFDAPEGLFTSTKNQQDADAQALAYLTGPIAQAYANDHGTCSGGSGATYEPVYNSNGCFSGQMVNAADSTDVRQATSAELQQYGGGNDNDGNPCPL